MIGRGEVEGANLIINAKGLPLTAEQFLERREIILAQYFPDAVPMPGKYLVYHLAFARQASYDSASLLPQVPERLQIIFTGLAFRWLWRPAAIPTW